MNYRPDIKRIVSEAEKPLTMTQLANAFPNASAIQCVEIINTALQMATEGEIQKLEAPPGSGKGVRFVYGKRA